MGAQPAPADGGPTTADLAYERYAGAMLQLAMLERDQQSSPMVRRLQAFHAAECWRQFIAAFTSSGTSTNERG